MRRKQAFVAVACGVSALVGCVSTQDLGSHVLPIDSGAPPTTIDGSVFVPGDSSAPGDSGHSGKIFFVTENRYAGDLATQGGASSGLAGGDALCTMEARTAGLGGVFKAWLSTSSENAKSRIASVGPWRSTGGTIVPFPDMAAGGLPQDYPRFTAKGTDLFFDNNADVWTGTKADGTVNDNNDTCAGWTSSLASAKGGRGALTWINGQWTDARALDTTSETSPCADRLRLYCFEQ